MIEFVQDFEEVANGSGHAVEGPDHNHLEPAMAGIRHQLVESGRFALAPLILSVYSWTIS